jgi:hypothetical protein
MSIRHVFVSAVLLGACLNIAGCAPSNTSAPAKVAAPEPFVAGEGEPQIWNPVAEDDPVRAAFGVVKFDDLPDLSNLGAVRLFGIGGGDPAMNGLNVYLAFVSPHDDRAFLLGDFRDYRVIAASPGRIDLEYDQDFMVEDQPQTGTFRTIVTWTETPQEPSPNPEYPATVTMTPAQ